MITEDPKRRVISKRALAAAVGKAVTKDGVTVDDGQGPVFVPANLVEELTGARMPKARPMRCNRVRKLDKALARRKQAKASRKRNR